MVLGGFLTANIELSRLERIAHTILLEERVHPGTYPPAGVAHLLQIARKLGEPHGLQPASETELEFLRLPVSFGTFTSGTVHLVVHFPMMSRSKEYLP